MPIHPSDNQALCLELRNLSVAHFRHACRTVECGYTVGNSGYSVYDALRSYHSAIGLSADMGGGQGAGREVGCGRIIILYASLQSLQITDQ